MPPVNVTTYFRARRARLRARGLCTQCAGKNEEPRFLLCGECRADYRRRHREKMAA